MYWTPSLSIWGLLQVKRNVGLFAALTRLQQGFRRDPIVRYATLQPLYPVVGLYNFTVPAHRKLHLCYPCWCLHVCLRVAHGSGSADQGYHPHQGLHRAQDEVRSGVFSLT